MASIFTLLSAVVVACIGFGNANEFVKVQCKGKNTGQLGHRSLLDCVIETSEEAKDATILIVTWKKVGDEEPLLKFDRGNLSTRKGYRFAVPSWNNKTMNVSLLITDTKIQHDAEYSCMVYADSGVDTEQTVLGVTATYNKPVITLNPKNNKQDQDPSLTCNTDGGYPQGELRWFDNSQTDWTGSAKFKATPGPDGRVHLSSTLRLSPGSTFPPYTCKVFNASGGKEEEVTIDFDNTSTDPHSGPAPVNHSSWVAPVVVIGSLIVGLLLLLLFLRRRSRQLRRNSAAPLMGERQAVSQEDADVEQGEDA